MRAPSNSRPLRLDPEKVAYWYLRLNGFLQIENFYVHPPGRGSARTDADLLAVRFPFRAERLYDAPDDLMQDDYERLRLSHDLIDVVITEVKAGPCALNGPWTNPEGENIHRVLAAIGCLPHERICGAAGDLYNRGLHYWGDILRLRLIAIGREGSDEIHERYPDVTQSTWPEIMAFIYERFRRYRNQKRQTENWDETGSHLRRLADKPNMSQGQFVDLTLDAMNIRY